MTTTVGPMEAELAAQQAAAGHPTEPIDTSDERFNELSQQATETNPSFVQPDAPMPEDTMVPLPGGYITQSGRLVREIEVRELTGEDEEALARFRSISSTALMGEILVRGIVSVGGEKVDKDAIGAMLCGDRDAAMLGVRRVTFGSTINFTDVVCPSCQKKFNINVGLDEIPMRKLDDPLARTVTVPLRHGGDAVMRFPTHTDSLATLEDDTRTAPEQNTVVIARCLESFQGRGTASIAFEREAIARKLGSVDREHILDAIGDAQPGPQLQEVKTNCPVCNFEAPVVIDLVSIFRT